MKSQPYLFFPIRTCHHSEMPDSNSQPGTLLNDLLHLGNLRCSVRQIYGKHHIPLFHIAEHLHHFLTIQHYPSLCKQQGLSRNFNSFETSCNEFFCLCQKPGLTELTHSANKEAIRITRNNFCQIFILNTINKFLCNNSSSHLRIVHVRQENFCTIHPVHHKGRNHLADFSHKQRTSIIQCTNG